MDDRHVERPTSDVTAAELVAQLRETRHRTRRLTENLSSNEMMGLRLDIVNPVLWEIGHVAWLHEYWTLRHAHGRAPLIERGDRLWDSSAVTHATRWQLDLPDRAGTFGYLADVLARQEDTLGGSVDNDTRYFYERAIRHEDMSRRYHIRARHCHMRARGTRRGEASRRGRPPRRCRGAGWDMATVLSRQRRIRVRPREMGARDRGSAVPNGAACACCFHQLIRGRGVVSLGRAAPAERNRMGGRRHRRADA